MSKGLKMLREGVFQIIKPIFSSPNPWGKYIAPGIWVLNT